MKKKITLIARIKLPAGSTTKAGAPLDYGYERLLTEKRGRAVKPNPPSDATHYYVRFTEGGKRQMKSVGTIFEDAWIAFLNEETRLEASKRGVPVSLPGANPDRESISAAAERFIKNQATLGKAPATVYGYTRAVEQFRDSCRKVYLDEITRQDMLDHIVWLRENVPTRSHGQQNGTVRTRLQFLTVFFTENGMKNPLPMKDWPKVEERKVEAYTSEQLNALLSAATPDEKDLIFFLVYTGFRDDEVAHALYSDVNFKTGEIKVGPKPEIGFTTKNGKERSVRVPADLTERLQERRERNPEGDLIFPNSKGRPDTALLARVRNAAKRAGYEGKVTLHRFRKTFGTRYGEKHGIVNAQHLLGHASIRTTQKYLAQTKIPAAAVEELFSDVAGK